LNKERKRSNPKGTAKNAEKKETAAAILSILSVQPQGLTPELNKLE